MLYADLPQSLRGPVVGQLEAYGALKLFVLSSEGKEWRRWRRRRKGVKKKKRVTGTSTGKDGGMVAR